MIYNKLKKKSMLIVAHRLATVKNCDVIIVMDYHFQYREYKLRTLVAVIIIIPFVDMVRMVFLKLNQSFSFGIMVGITFVLYWLYLKITQGIFLKGMVVEVTDKTIVITKNKSTLIDIEKIKNISLQQRSYFGEVYLIFKCVTEDNKSYKILTANLYNLKMDDHPLAEVFNMIRNNSGLYSVDYENSIYWELNKGNI